MRLFSRGPIKILNGRGARAPIPSSSSSESNADAEISASLKRKIQMLYVSHVSEAGVDYKGMRASASFSEYVAETRRLEQMDLAPVICDDAHRIAFFVNLYNALTQHAVTVLGSPPATSLFRLLYAMGVGYMVGPYRLSLNDIENGILRANRAVSVLPRPFGRGDARRELCVQRVDPRIHFVLNCGAMSCPPVLFLTAENLERSLDIATKGFLKSRDNLQIDGNRVLLSMIFKWYAEDFSAEGGERGVLEWIVENGDSSQKEIQEVRRILEQFSQEVALGWKEYDWSVNRV